MPRRHRRHSHWLAFALIVGMLLAPSAAVARFEAATPAATPTRGTCSLPGSGSAIQHAIFLQFDNVHFSRDNPNVPSDLEQMPHLLNFLEQNGVVLTNEHTPLIAHTGTDLLTGMTGVYGDKHGVPVANSYRYFNPNGTSSTGVSFAYWTSPIYDPMSKSPTDTSFNMLSAPRTNAPAPWVPFTRAGCDVGSVATANTVLENIGIDIPTVFGATSPEAAEVKTDPTKASADFVGLAVHCAQGSANCDAAHGGQADLLPSEPGGYIGFNGLFGNKTVAPLIHPGGPMTDLARHVITDAKGNPGFPGFDGMSAAVSLSYVAAMQEHGIPITYAYLSDAHDRHPSGPAYGPGQAGYIAALKSYDAAFATFFDRLARDGITPANTLFVVSADEGDHFAGGDPSPTTCNGVTTPCTYDKIGEVNVNLTGVLATQAGITTPFAVHADSAPTIYVAGQPGPSDPNVRKLERTLAALTVTNPYTGQTEPLANYLADPVEMKLLHMVTADQARTPTLTVFAKPDYFVVTADPNCTKPCVTIESDFAWNHGTVAPEVNQTWAAFAGPGIHSRGVDADTWTDQTDLRPTAMALLGLKDDYVHDGRVIIEIMADNALSPVLQSTRESFIRLATLYKQLNAPVGDFGLTSLSISTMALASDTPHDTAFVAWESALANLGGTRDAVAAQMAQVLDGAAFSGQPLRDQDVAALLTAGHALLARVHALASNPPASPASAASPTTVPAGTPVATPNATPAATPTA